MRADEYIPYHMKELCEKHHITKYRLSQLTGMSQTALANIMAGTSVPTVLTLEKICDAFGISLAQFFTSEGGLPDLTDEQRELLEEWDKLELKEREILMIFVRSLENEDG